MKLEPKRVLFGIWIAVSSVSTVISLASLTDGIIAWSQFMNKLIESYRAIAAAIWGNFFSIFSIELPQFGHDYFTINTLFAVSIAWGLFNSSATLGFKLGSFTEFVKNNLAQFTVAQSVLRNFSANARSRFQKSAGGITKPLGQAIAHISREYRTIRLVTEGVLSIGSFFGLYFTFSFPIPSLMRWLDVRHHRTMMRVLSERRAEIDSLEMSEAERDVLYTAFDESCVVPGQNEIQIIELYHSELRKSLRWYLLAVLAIFILVVFLNYVGMALFSGASTN